MSRETTRYLTCRRAVSETGSEAAKEGCDVRFAVERSKQGEMGNGRRVHCHLGSGAGGEHRQKDTRGEAADAAASTGSSDKSLRLGLTEGLDQSGPWKSERNVSKLFLFPAFRSFLVPGKKPLLSVEIGGEMRTLTLLGTKPT